jgi:hypothetical protein
VALTTHAYTGVYAANWSPYFRSSLAKKAGTRDSSLLGTSHCRLAKSCRRLRVCCRNIWRLCTSIGLLRPWIWRQEYHRNVSNNSPIDTASYPIRIKLHQYHRENLKYEYGGCKLKLIRNVGNNSPIDTASYPTSGLNASRRKRTRNYSFIISYPRRPKFHQYQILRSSKGLPWLFNKKNRWI